MKIRARTLLIFALAVVLLCVIAYELTAHIILSQFAELDRQLMLQRVERFHLDVQSRLRPVAAAVADWAASGRMRRFLSGSSPPALDIGADSLRILGLNFAGVWDAEGKFVSGTSLADGADGVRPMSRELAGKLSGDRFVPLPAPGDSASGRVLLDDRICFVSAAPVRAADGAMIGTVVVGSILSNEDLKEIELFSGYRLGIIPLTPAGEARLPAEVREGLKTGGENPVIEPVSDTDIAAFSIQSDFQGRPLFVAELVSPRVLYAAGERSSRFFLSALVMGCGVLFFVVWYLSDRTVLTPIRRLEDRVNAASLAGELPNDLGFKGSDEISMLARQIEGLARSVRDAEARYRTIVEEQTEFIARYKPDGTLTFVNRALAGFLGRNRSALVGTNFALLFPEEERGPLRERILRLRPEAPTFTMEQRFVRDDDGDEHWLSRFDRGEFDDVGELVSVQSVMRDVTESRRAERDLQQSEARYRTFFEAAADGIMIVDGTDERILDVNPGLCQLFGWPKEHFVGEIFWKLSTFQRLVSRISTVQSTVLWPGIRRMLAVELRRRNGESVFVDVITVSYLSAGRQVVQWNFRDVTATRKTEDALRHLSGRLLRLQDEERRRIARELHDSTGQNLSALQINLSRLDTAITAPDALHLLREGRALADKCSAEIRTISYLLHPPLLDEVGLGFAVKWFAEGFARRAGVAVDLEIPDDFPRLSPEVETSLFRVVQEAMSNVYRHSRSKTASLTVAVTPENVIVEIRDAGAGIPADVIDAVNNSQSSLGVGLAGMRERIVQLGGKLVVSSDSTGTTVHATIPATEILPCPTSAS